MVAITELNWNVIEKVLEHAFKMHRPRPPTCWHSYNHYMIEPLLSVALTCREWLQLVRQMLAREEWFKWAYLQSLRLVRAAQKMATPAFYRLSPNLFGNLAEDRVGDLTAVDVPDTAAHFARAVFNLSILGDEASANDELRTNRAAHFACFQIRDEEAMNTFLSILEHDMLQLMEKAVLYVAMMANNEHETEGLGVMEMPIVRGADLFSAVISADHSKQPQTAFMGSLDWKQHAPPPTDYRAPDVGVSLDAQVRIVATLARRAGIPRFDATFTQLAWWILVNRAKHLVLNASMIATSGLDPNGHAPRFDDDMLSDSGGPSEEFVYDSADDSDSDYEPEERDEEESDSDSGYGTHLSDDDEDEEHKKKKPPSRDMVDVAKDRAAKRRRTCRFDPVLHDGENIAEDWHFKTHHYVVNPSPRCFHWAYEHM